MEALPLDAVLGSCRVIEIHDQTAITAAELEPHNLQRGERILFKTRNSTRSWQSDDFDEDFIYIAQDGAGISPPPACRRSAWTTSAWAALRKTA